MSDARYRPLVLNVIGGLSEVSEDILLQNLKMWKGWVWDAEEVPVDPWRPVVTRFLGLLKEYIELLKAKRAAAYALALPLSSGGTRSQLEASQKKAGSSSDPSCSTSSADRSKILEALCVEVIKVLEFLGGRYNKELFGDSQLGVSRVLLEVAVEPITHPMILAKALAIMSRSPSPIAGLEAADKDLKAAFLQRLSLLSEGWEFFLAGADLAFMAKKKISLPEDSFVEIAKVPCLPAEPVKKKMEKEHAEKKEKRGKPDRDDRTDRDPPSPTLGTQTAKIGIPASHLGDDQKTVEALIVYLLKKYPNLASLKMTKILDRLSERISIAKALFSGFETRRLWIMIRTFAVQVRFRISSNFLHKYLQNYPSFLSDLVSYTQTVLPHAKDEHSSFLVRPVLDFLASATLEGGHGQAIGSLLGVSLPHGPLFGLLQIALNPRKKIDPAAIIAVVNVMCAAVQVAANPPLVAHSGVINLYLDYVLKMQGRASAEKGKERPDEPSSAQELTMHGWSANAASNVLRSLEVFKDYSVQALESIVQEQEKTELLLKATADLVSVCIQDKRSNPASIRSTKWCLSELDAAREQHEKQGLCNAMIKTLHMLFTSADRRERMPALLSTTNQLFKDNKHLGNILKRVLKDSVPPNPQLIGSKHDCMAVHLIQLLTELMGIDPSFVSTLVSTGVVQDLMEMPFARGRFLTGTPGFPVFELRCDLLQSEQSLLHLGDCVAQLSASFLAISVHSTGLELLKSGVEKPEEKQGGSTRANPMTELLGLLLKDKLVTQKILRASKYSRHDLANQLALNVEELVRKMVPSSAEWKRMKDRGDPEPDWDPIRIVDLMIEALEEQMLKVEVGSAGGWEEGGTAGCDRAANALATLTKFGAQFFRRICNQSPNNFDMLSSASREHGQAILESFVSKGGFRAVIFLLSHPCMPPGIAFVMASSLHPAAQLFKHMTAHFTSCWDDAQSGQYSANPRRKQGLIDTGARARKSEIACHVDLVCLLKSGIEILTPLLEVLVTPGGRDVVDSIFSGKTGEVKPLSPSEVLGGLSRISTALGLLALGYKDFSGSAHALTSPALLELVKILSSPIPSGAKERPFNFWGALLLLASRLEVNAHLDRQRAQKKDESESATSAEKAKKDSSQDPPLSSPVFLELKKNVTKDNLPLCDAYRHLVGLNMQVSSSDPSKILRFLIKYSVSAGKQLFSILAKLLPPPTSLIVSPHVVKTCDPEAEIGISATGVLLFAQFLKNNMELANKEIERAFSKSGEGKMENDNRPSEAAACKNDENNKTQKLDGDKVGELRMSDEVGSPQLGDETPLLLPGQTEEKGAESNKVEALLASKFLLENFDCLTRAHIDEKAHSVGGLHLDIWVRLQGPQVLVDLANKVKNVFVKFSAEEALQSVMSAALGLLLNYIERTTSTKRLLNDGLTSALKQKKLPLTASLKEKHPFLDSWGRDPFSISDLSTSIRGLFMNLILNFWRSDDVVARLGDKQMVSLLRVIIHLVELLSAEFAPGGGGGTQDAAHANLQRSRALMFRDPMGHLNFNLADVGGEGGRIPDLDSVLAVSRQIHRELTGEGEAIGSSGGGTAEDGNAPRSSIYTSVSLPEALRETRNKILAGANPTGSPSMPVFPTLSSLLLNDISAARKIRNLMVPTLTPSVDLAHFYLSKLAPVQMEGLMDSAAVKKSLSSDLAKGFVSRFFEISSRVLEDCKVDLAPALERIALLGLVKLNPSCSVHTPDPSSSKSELEKVRRAVVASNVNYIASVALKYLDEPRSCVAACHVLQILVMGGKGAKIDGRISFWEAGLGHQLVDEWIRLIRAVCAEKMMKQLQGRTLSCRGQSILYLGPEAVEGESLPRWVHPLNVCVMRAVEMYACVEEILPLAKQKEVIDCCVLLAKAYPYMGQEPANALLTFLHLLTHKLDNARYLFRNPQERLWPLLLLGRTSSTENWDGCVRGIAQILQLVIEDSVYMQLVAEEMVKDHVDNEGEPQLRTLLSLDSLTKIGLRSPEAVKLAIKNVCRLQKKTSNNEKMEDKEGEDSEFLLVKKRSSEMQFTWDMQPEVAKETRVFVRTLLDICGELVLLAVDLAGVEGKKHQQPYPLSISVEGAMYILYSTCGRVLSPALSYLLENHPVMSRDKEEKDAKVAKNEEVVEPSPNLSLTSAAHSDIPCVALETLDFEFPLSNLSADWSKSTSFLLDVLLPRLLALYKLHVEQGQERKSLLLLLTQWSAVAAVAAEANPKEVSKCALAFEILERTAKLGKKKPRSAAEEETLQVSYFAWSSILYRFYLCGGEVPEPLLETVDENSGKCVASRLRAMCVHFIQNISLTRNDAHELLEAPLACLEILTRAISKNPQRFLKKVLKKNKVASGEMEEGEEEEEEEEDWNSDEYSDLEAYLSDFDDFSEEDTSSEESDSEDEIHSELGVIQEEAEGGEGEEEAASGEESSSGSDDSSSDSDDASGTEIEDDSGGEGEDEQEVLDALQGLDDEENHDGLGYGESLEEEDYEMGDMGVEESEIHPQGEQPEDLEEEAELEEEEQLRDDADPDELELEDQYSGYSDEDDEEEEAVVLRSEEDTPPRASGAMDEVYSEAYDEPYNDVLDMEEGSETTSEDMEIEMLDGEALEGDGQMEEADRRFLTLPPSWPNPREDAPKEVQSSSLLALLHPSRHGQLPWTFPAEASTGDDSVTLTFVGFGPLNFDRVTAVPSSSSYYIGTIYRKQRDAMLASMDKELEVAEPKQSLKARETMETLPEKEEENQDQTADAEKTDEQKAEPEAPQEQIAATEAVAPLPASAPPQEGVDVPAESSNPTAETEDPYANVPEEDVLLGSLPFLSREAARLHVNVRSVWRLTGLDFETMVSSIPFEMQEDIVVDAIRNIDRAALRAEQGEEVATNETRDFLMSLPQEFRQEAFLTATENVIAELPEQLREEARALRARHHIRADAGDEGGEEEEGEGDEPEGGGEGAGPQDVHGIQLPHGRLMSMFDNPVGRMPSRAEPPRPVADLDSIFRPGNSRSQSQPLQLLPGEDGAMEFFGGIDRHPPQEIFGRVGQAQGHGVPPPLGGLLHSTSQALPQGQQGGEIWGAGEGQDPRDGLRAIFGQSRASSFASAGRMRVGQGRNQENSENQGVRASTGLQNPPKKRLGGAWCTSVGEFARLSDQNPGRYDGDAKVAEKYQDLLTQPEAGAIMEQKDFEKQEMIERVFPLPLDPEELGSLMRCMFMKENLLRSLLDRLMFNVSLYPKLQGALLQLLIKGLISATVPKEKQGGQLPLWSFPEPIDVALPDDIPPEKLFQPADPSGDFFVEESSGGALAEARSIGCGRILHVLQVLLQQCPRVRVWLAYPHIDESAPTPLPTPRMAKSPVKGRNMSPSRKEKDVGKSKPSLIPGATLKPLKTPRGPPSPSAPGFSRKRRIRESGCLSDVGDIKRIRTSRVSSAPGSRGASHVTDETSCADFADSVEVSPRTTPVNVMIRLLNTPMLSGSPAHTLFLVTLLHLMVIAPESEKDDDGEGKDKERGERDREGLRRGEEGNRRRTQSGRSQGGEGAGATGEEAMGDEAGKDEKKKKTFNENLSLYCRQIHKGVSSTCVASLCAFLAGQSPGSDKSLSFCQVASAERSKALRKVQDIICTLGSALDRHKNTIKKEMARCAETTARVIIQQSTEKGQVSMERPAGEEQKITRILQTMRTIYGLAPVSNSGTSRDASHEKAMWQRRARVGGRASHRDVIGELNAENAKPEEYLKFVEDVKLDALWEALDTSLSLHDGIEGTKSAAQAALEARRKGESSHSTPNSGAERSQDPDGAQGPGARGGGGTARPYSSYVSADLLKLLPLIEVFLLCHNVGAAADPGSNGALGHVEEGSSPTSGVSRAQQSLIQFCTKHRRPLNLLIKGQPSLLTRSFAPLIRHCPWVLDFDNKRQYFRTRLKEETRGQVLKNMQIRVRRDNVFEDSVQTLGHRRKEELRGKIVITFQGEEGMDAGGLTREWYSLLAKAMFNPMYALFKQAGGRPNAFHPNPASAQAQDEHHLRYFKFCGRIIGKAIYDNQRLDCYFTRGFYKLMLGRKVIPSDLEAMDPDYYKNLRLILEHNLEDIGMDHLTFSEEDNPFGGPTETFDLIPGGRHKSVTDENKDEYVDLCSHFKLYTAVEPQIEAFMKGFHEMIPADLVGALFDDKELELLISGLPTINLKDLKENTEYVKYHKESPQIEWFWRCLEKDFTPEELPLFLQFVTGSSQVPLEGFAALLGMRGPQKFSIHRAYNKAHLPSAHTCFNQLDLPEYDDEDTLRKKLKQAVMEAHSGFGLV